MVRNNPPAALLGLGTMGRALAERLLAGGDDVSLWNRSPGPVKAFAATGARIAATPAEAVGRASVVVICLSDHAATESAVMTDSVADAIGGKTVLQLTTVTAAESRALADWTTRHGARYLEGQIQDYPSEVRSGKATIFCAGSMQALGACSGVLATLAGEAPHVSVEVGAAATLDKALFAFEFTALAGALHGAAMCEAGGVPEGLYLERLLLPFLRTGPFPETVRRMLISAAARSYDRDVEATLEVFRAAYGKTLSVSEDAGPATAHLRGVDRLMERAIGMGHGQHDFPALIEAIRSGGS